MNVQMRVTSHWNARATRSNAADVFADVVGSSPRTAHAGRRYVSWPALGLTDAQLDFPNGRQMLIDLRPIVDTEPIAKLLCVVGDKIENRLCDKARV